MSEDFVDLNITRNSMGMAATIIEDDSTVEVTTTTTRTYDDNYRRTDLGFTHDDQNRVSSYTDGSATHFYEYDEAGRLKRVWQEDGSGTVTQEIRKYYIGSQLVAEVSMIDSSGNENPELVAHYLYAGGTPLAMTTGYAEGVDKRFTYVTDAAGSVRGLLDGTDWAMSYAYDPLGAEMAARNMTAGSSTLPGRNLLRHMGAQAMWYGENQGYGSASSDPDYVGTFTLKRLTRPGWGGSVGGGTTGGFVVDPGLNTNTGGGVFQVETQQGIHGPSGQLGFVNPDASPIWWDIAGGILVNPSNWGGGDYDGQTRVDTSTGQLYYWAEDIGQWTPHAVITTTATPTSDEKIDKVFKTGAGLVPGADLPWKVADFIQAVRDLFGLPPSADPGASFLYIPGTPIIIILLRDLGSGDGGHEWASAPWNPRPPKHLVVIDNAMYVGEEVGLN